MARRRRRKRNPSSVLDWAKAHPYLTTFFVLPSVIGFPIALIRALRPAPVQTSAPSAGPNNARLMPLE